MIKIYFDLDGVLADFHGYVKANLGIDFDSSLWPELLANHPRMYSNLQPIEEAVKMFQEFRKTHKVEILTALPSLVTFEHASEDKISWVRKHLGGVKVNIAKKSFDKQFFCREGDILIDDNPMNVQQWNERGGIGLLFNRKE